MTVSLPQVQSLYDQNRFLEAFGLTEGYWKKSQRLEELSSDELIFAGRLAARVGGSRLSRRLLRAAFEVNPRDARVRYFTLSLRWRKLNLFDELRQWEVNPELDGADADTQASWLASQAVIWASYRDFDRAESCLERAKSLRSERSWVFSCESDVFRLKDRRNDALRSAEIAWEMNQGTPYGTRSLGESLVSLGRIPEAAARLSAAASTSESFEVALLACWYACALAETIEGDERNRVLGGLRVLLRMLRLGPP